MFGFRVDAEINQLRWAMEEKVNRDIILVWFSPATLPHSAVMAADIKINGG